jgi:hypothetical protein
MKNIRNFALFILVAAGAVGANAQNALSGKVQFPSEVRWGKAILPAGEYSLSIPSMQRPVRMFINSMDGKVGAIALADPSDVKPGGSYIFITGTGSDRQVRSVNLPQLGVSLVYAPLTARERERLHASVSQTLAIHMTRK